jgi:hypothetical protein
LAPLTPTLCNEAELAGTPPDRLPRAREREDRPTCSVELAVPRVFERKEP